MFGSIGNLGDMARLFKDAGKLKERMEVLQEQLGDTVVEGSAGGGMVKARANGRQEIVSVEIDKEIATSADTEMLQDLVVAACNAALERSKEMLSGEFAKLTGGLGINIPGIM
ncbi:MAG: YbaB/EbfC family nucleoid-associated protein [Planctomycetes bacterium]|nr:YbaB/EbfC family nucleoid-associated protein [Planctomycetota bacterium]